jgi:hypothetical protein
VNHTWYTMGLPPISGFCCLSAAVDVLLHYAGRCCCIQVTSTFQPGGLQVGLRTSLSFACCLGGQVACHVVPLYTGQRVCTLLNDS